MIEKSRMLVMVGIVILSVVSVFFIHEFQGNISGRFVTPTTINVYMMLSMLAIIGVSFFILFKN